MNVFFKLREHYRKRCEGKRTQQEILKDIQIRVKDIQDRIYDDLARNTDTQIRVQDIQDRTYDNLAKNTDMQIRVQDIQDRAYDILWQQKTSNHQREMMFWQIYKLPNESLEETKIRFFHTIPKATGNQRKSQLILASLLKEICELCEQNNLSYWLDFGTLIGAIRHDGFIPWDDDIDIGMMRKDAEKLAELLQADRAGRFLFRKCFLNQVENGIIQVFQIRYADTPFGSVVPSLDIFFYDYCESYGSDAWNLFQEEKNKLVEESKDHVRTPVPFQFDAEKDEEYRLIWKQYYHKLEKTLHYHEDNGPCIIFGNDNLHYLNYQDEHVFLSDNIFPLKKLVFEGHAYFVPNRYLDYIMPMYGDIFSLPSDMLSHKHAELKPSDQEKLDTMFEKYCQAE